MSKPSGWSGGLERCVTWFPVSQVTRCCAAPYWNTGSAGCVVSHMPHMSRSEDAGGLFNNALMDGAGERGTEKACLLMAGWRGGWTRALPIHHGRIQTRSRQTHDAAAGLTPARQRRRRSMGTVRNRKSFWHGTSTHMCFLASSL